MILTLVDTKMVLKNVNINKQGNFVVMIVKSHQYFKKDEIGNSGWEVSNILII